MNYLLIKSTIVKTVTVLVIVLAAVFAAGADGFIIIDEPPPRMPDPEPFPLEVKYHYVDVEIKGLTATTSIDQVFYNPTGYQLEGTYMFPVPENAVIRSFSMYINGKETRAELLDAERARTIYEDIVRNMRDPALLEYTGRKMYKVRIFPIEPGSTKRVKLTYTQVLTKDSGTAEYLYPLNTEKFSAKPLDEVRVSVHITSDQGIKNVFCTTHETEIIRKSAREVTVTYEAANVKPQTDFRVYYAPDQTQLGLSLVPYKKAGQEGYFFLDIDPGLAESSDSVLPKDVTFVLDTSGSMAGEKLEQAKKALNFCINSLYDHDRFEVVRFSTDAEGYFNSLVPASRENINQALAYVKDLQPIGGTYIDGALELALEQGESDRLHLIVFITDGRPTVGERNEDRILKKIKRLNSRNTRIFSFGIGYQINTHLLDRLTELTRAYRSYITPAEDIELSISNFFVKVASPVLTDVKLSFNGGARPYTMYPGQLPDIFSGTSLSLLGRYRGSGNTTIKLEGIYKNKKQVFEYKVNFPETRTDDQVIPALWASRRVGYLLDQIRLYGEEKELVDEVVHLARTYGIITPYTSYLILEDEEVRVRRRELNADHQTLNSMAEGQREFEEVSKDEYKKMEEDSGEASVRTSKEVQELNLAKNIDQTRQGQDRLDYIDDQGNRVNLTSQVQNIQGRAVYNTGGYWIDSLIQETTYKRVKRIKFAGKDYFTLLQKNPGAAEFMALGNNVKFVLDDVLYEIYE